MNIDFQKLETEKREIEEFLAKPEAYLDSAFAEKSRRGAEISEILELKAKLDKDEESLKEAKELLGDSELGSWQKKTYRDCREK